MTNDNIPTPMAAALIVADLPTNRTTFVKIAPDGAQRQILANELGVLSIRKLQFEIELAPRGKSGWHLTANLGATVIQACVITLAPVTTRIDETPERHFVKSFPETDEGSEQEIPDDDTLELIGHEIDPVQVMLETLALALPQFPRAEGAELVEQIFTEPGKKPMSDADSRPFAQLSALQQGLKDDTD